MSCCRCGACILLGLFLWILPARAQVNVGQNLTVGLTGDLGIGYNGDFGNQQGSDHTYGLNGDANLNGYYYSPNFLNFHLAPYYNRSQANSGSGSITDASSIGGGVGLFGGSHYPGGISYGKSFDSSNSYGIPGSQGILTHGNATQFGIGWGESIPGLPPLTAQYSQGAAVSTAFGTSEETHSDSRVFTLGSNYRLAGWWLNGRFTDVSTKTQVPEFLSNGVFSESDNSSKSLNITGNHRLPFSGQTTVGYAYDTFGGSGNGQSVTGSDQSVTASASFVPIRRFSASFGAEYDTSLSGMVQKILANAGSVNTGVDLGANSHSLTMYNFDSIALYKNLDASVALNRTQEEVYGVSLTVNHFSAVVNYHFQKPLWGSVVVYGGVNDFADQTGNQGTGVIAGVNFARRQFGFEWDGGFNYSQNIETVLEQVSSSYTYLASARRPFGRHTTWNTSFSGYHTGLGESAGTTSHSDSYATTLLYRRYSTSASYATSYGASLVTQGGLVSAPVYIAPVLSSNQFLLVNGSSIGLTATASPVNRLSLNANFAKAVSSVTSPSVNATGSSKAYTFYTQYQLRKVSFGAGYTKVMQGIGTGTVGSVPENYTSYYIGITRWFNPF